MIKRLLKSTNVAYFSLLGGVDISTSVGIYSTLMIQSALPERWGILAISAAIFAIAGWLWTLLAVELAEIRSPIDNAPPSVTFADREKAWQAVYEKKKRYLFSLFSGAILLTIVALIMLPFGPLADKSLRPQTKCKYHLNR